MARTGGFQRVLSIGADCQPAFQIEHAFGKTRGVFDWLVTPIDSVLEVLKDGGAGLAVDFIAPPGGHTVICGRYGLLYHHEFVMAPDGGVNFSLEACSQVKEKFKHKMSQFDQACHGEGRTLFVRRKIATGIGGDRFNHEPFTSAEANRLVEGIASRYPDLDFSVLLALTEKDLSRTDLSGDTDPRVLVRHVPEGTGVQRLGPDEWWDERFEEFGLTARVAEAESLGLS